MESNAAPVDSGAAFCFGPELLHRDFDLFPLGFGELHVCGCDVFFEVLDGAGAWDRDDDGTAVQEPRDGELADGGVVFASGDVERAAGLGELAGRDREPWDEGDIVLGAVVDDVFVGAVGEVVFVLDGDDVDDLARPVDLMRLHFAEADVADLALLLKLFDDSEGLFDGDFGVDSVELPEVDALELQEAKAHLDLLVEVLGTADGEPLVGALAGEAAFGGDDDVVDIGGEGLTNEPFGDVGAVGVGGVDEVDAELDGAAEDFAGVFGVIGLAPDASADDAHGAEAEAMDGEVSAE